jgi:L-iditol 2-dehydrogenase
MDEPSSAALLAEQVPAGTMKAAVYRGAGRVVVEEVPVPAIGPGELLVRVACCGVCNTDVKKVQSDLLPPPRIYGHETAGVVAAAGPGVSTFAPGDRVVVFHHIPCGNCYYCRACVYAQCPVYKKVGVTAGFEPAGGGFAEYVRVMDWIVARGVARVPDHVSFEEATFVEPVNTCLKAVRTAALHSGETVLIQGQGPIGLLFLMLAQRQGCRVVVSDPMEERLAIARKLAPAVTVNPRLVSAPAAVQSLTEGRGADAVIVAAPHPALVQEALDAVRPGGRVLLFAQTSRKDRLEAPAAAVCVDEKQILGSYSADVDLQEESARLVFEGRLPLRDLITHRFGLEGIEPALALAGRPTPQSLKVMIHLDGRR